MIPVLEAVPNFSEGRDLDKLRSLVDTIARKGVDILDWSADSDHHRSVRHVYRRSSLGDICFRGRS